MKIYCREHCKFEKVVGYHKGDPILECGVVKQRTEDDDVVDKCRGEIDKFLTVQSINGGKVDDAREVLISYMLGLYLKPAG